MTRDDLVDAGALALLAVIALLGLRTVLDGSSWMVVGSVGIIVGTVAGWTVSARRMSPLFGLLVVIGAFFFGGGIAVPDDAIAGFLPGPLVPAALIDALVHSWKELVTTAPPVAVIDGIGVIPYLLGFATTSCGLVLARRTDQPLAPAIPAILALVVGIVLGTTEPAALLVQGTVFAVAVIGWGAVRSNRSRRSTDGVYWPRVLSASAMLAVVVGFATVAAGSLPLASSASRTVARKEIVPPFDLSDYPSPLAGYRDYTVDRAEDVLFEVEGFPKGARIRLATMDRYDGVVWSVSGSDANGSGRFERVGTRVTDPPDGAPADLSFTVDTYRDVWIPTVGALAAASFGGEAADELSRSFRYNRRTHAAASPVILEEGDVVDLDVRVPAIPDRAELRGEAVGQFDLPPLPQDEAVQKDLGEILAKSNEILAKAPGSSPLDTAETLERELHTEGRFANGDSSKGGPAELVSVSGHSVSRLAKMVTAPQMKGDAEQYAALLALMLRLQNVPARVVVGFAPEGSGDLTLTGADLDAWVEVKFDGVDAWVPFDPTPEEKNTPDIDPQVNRNESNPSVQPPPPDHYIEPPVEVDPSTAEREDQESQDRRDVGGGFAIPGFVRTILRYAGPPVLLIAVVAGSVVGAKALRRRRRRSSGGLPSRVNGAWLEAVDFLRDLGLRPDPSATRRELAVAAGEDVGWAAGQRFAARIDAAMFGPAVLDDGAVQDAWGHLDAELDALRAPMPRGQRIRAALSPASLVRVRRPRQSTRSPAAGGRPTDPAPSTRP
ncbi:MAG: hypothetical protein KF906_05100 [Actinobacteria bacterium]|nr:hypothetical protein [Actinomycetota bacterium]